MPTRKRQKCLKLKLFYPKNFVFGRLWGPTSGRLNSPNIPAWMCPDMFNPLKNWNCYAESPPYNMFHLLILHLCPIFNYSVVGSTPCVSYRTWCCDIFRIFGSRLNGSTLNHQRASDWPIDHIGNIFQGRKYSATDIFANNNKTIRDGGILPWH